MAPPLVLLRTLPVPRQHAAFLCSKPTGPSLPLSQGGQSRPAIAGKSVPLGGGRGMGRQVWTWLSVVVSSPP